MSLPERIACPDCDLLLALPALAPGEQACCPRCGYLLARQPRWSRDTALALTVTAVITFLMANTAPLMSLSAVGRSASTTILGGAVAMWTQGERLTGALVGFCVVLAPAGYLAYLLILQLAARRPRVPSWAGEMLRAAEHVQLWSMLEVMMLGILVALTKIAALATVEPGIGMFAVGATMLLLPAVAVNFDTRDVWERVRWPGGGPA